MAREWKPGELETVRLLHSPIFTEKTIEEHWRNLDNLRPKAKESVLFAQKYSIEGFMEAVRCLITNGIITLNERDLLTKNTLDAIWELVPHEPSKIWTKSGDDDEILCKDKQTAEAIADLIDAMYGDQVTKTGYYDPTEDERNDEIDKYTGYYYVTIN